MNRPRLAFVLQDALGWRTYRAQLERVLRGREDIEARVVSVSLSRWDTLLHKRNNMRQRDHLFRRIDPIDAFSGRSGRTVRAMLSAFSPDAVHFAAHWPAAAIAQAPAAPPFTVTLDNTRAGIERDLPRDAWNPKDMAREAALLRGAAHMFPMSRWAAGSLRDDCGVADTAITVMPPSIDLKRFRPEARSDNAPGKLRVVFIGNDIRRKGAARLVEWIKGPLADMAELHIVSGDPASRSLADHAIVHGRVPNDRLVGELLPSMDVLCLPTRSDMSPQVLAEAAAAGLPAVASAIGGIPDLVIDGQTGFTPDAADDVGFVQALGGLAEDRRLARQMGDAALKHAHAHFDAARNFNDLIDRLVSLASVDRGKELS